MKVYVDKTREKKKKQDEGPVCMASGPSISGAGCYLLYTFPAAARMPYLYKYFVYNKYNIRVCGNPVLLFGMHQEV